MPAADSPPPRPSYTNISWATLPELDLSLFSTPSGQQKLASQLKDAIRNHGFFVVKNFGISDEDIEAQFEMGKSIFELPLEEKVKYHDKEKWARGDIRGYRPIGSKLITKGNFKGPHHKDNVEFYNVSKQDGVHDMQHPFPVQQKLDQIQDFTKQINTQIVHPLLTLIGLILQLPNPSILCSSHSPNQQTSNNSLLRYLDYHPLSYADSDANNGIYVAPHVDFGTFTCSFRQPVAGLQFRDFSPESDEASKDGKGNERWDGKGEGNWKWVKPMSDGVLVNAADWLGVVTGRWVRSGVHRVHAPPIEQEGLERLAVIYFATPDDDAIVECVKGSPVLKALGIGWNEDELEEGLREPEFHQAWIARLKRQQAKLQG